MPTFFRSVSSSETSLAGVTVVRGAATFQGWNDVSLDQSGVLHLAAPLDCLPFCRFLGRIEELNFRTWGASNHIGVRCSFLDGRVRNRCSWSLLKLRTSWLADEARRGGTTAGSTTSSAACSAQGPYLPLVFDPISPSLLRRTVILFKPSTAVVAATLFVFPHC